MLYQCMSRAVLCIRYEIILRINSKIIIITIIIIIIIIIMFYAPCIIIQL
jgi:hypothetical protein